MFGLITLKNLPYGPITDGSAKELSSWTIKILSLLFITLVSREAQEQTTEICSGSIYKSKLLLTKHKAHAIGTHQPWSLLALGILNTIAKQTFSLNCCNRIFYTWTKRQVYMQVTYSMFSVGQVVFEALMWFLKPLKTVCPHPLNTRCLIEC